MCGKPPRENEGGWIPGIPSCRRFEIAKRAERLERRHPNDTALKIPLGFLDTRLHPEATIPEIENTCDEGEWLEIAMDHAVVMGMLECLADGDADLSHLAPVEPLADVQLVFEAGAVDQLHRIKQHAVLFSVAKQANDVFVTEFL